MISIKSPREIDLMRKAGRLTAKVFEEVGPLVKPGVSTQFLADKAEEVIRSEGGIPASKGYGGFPGAICASVNEVLVHGIPSNKKILSDGDIISLDVVVKLNGYHGDACRTYPVGIVGEDKLKLIKVTEECFWEGVSKVKAGVRLGDVEHAIQEKAESNGYSVVREFTGHGIGREMHEDPFIFNYGERGHGIIIRKNMCLAIEPMIHQGSAKIRNLDDGWGVASADGKLTCHFENTIYIDDDGPHITTIDSVVKGYLSNVER